MKYCNLMMAGAAAVMALSSLAAQATIIEAVSVGNAGNEADTRYTTSPFGAVDYVYQMGKTEVTNTQYCDFLNAKAKNDSYALYNTSMASDAQGGINRSGSSPNYSYAVKAGYENMPVNFVSWYDTVRFANWLQNGQGSGSTESGTYTITGGGQNSGTVTVPDAATRASWTVPHWALPSEDEWYKAAYYDPNKSGGAGYWDYATGTNVTPYSDNPASLDFPANSANYYNNDGIGNGYNDGFAVTGSATYDPAQCYLTNVGAYSQSLSPYGTLDQNGNVYEWTEAAIGVSRGIRGGEYATQQSSLKADCEDGGRYPTVEGANTGFRVALVPEPSCMAMLGGIAIMALLYFRRRFA